MDLNNELSKEKIEKLLSGRHISLPVVVLKETDSTNNVAKEMILKNGIKEGVIVADCQTNGRGRVGHTFFSPKGAGIYLSYIFTPKSLKGAEKATTKACVCVLNTIKSLYGILPKIKWVNDLYLDGKKICGILTEAVTTGINQGSIVVGIGINYMASNVPKELTDIVGSLPNNESVSRNDVISELIVNLSKELQDLSSTDYIKVYRKNSFLIGENITFIKGEATLKAKVLDISEDAGLIVQYESGEKEILRNGEVFTIRKTTS